MATLRELIEAFEGRAKDNGGKCQVKYRGGLRLYPPQDKPEMWNEDARKGICLDDKFGAKETIATIDEFIGKLQSLVIEYGNDFQALCGSSISIFPPSFVSAPEEETA